MSGGGQWDQRTGNHIPGVLHASRGNTAAVKQLRIIYIYMYILLVGGLEHILFLHILVYIYNLYVYTSTY